MFEPQIKLLKEKSDVPVVEDRWPETLFKIEELKNSLETQDESLSRRLKDQDNFIKDIEKRSGNYSDTNNKSVIAIVARINTLEEKLEGMDDSV